MRRWSLSILLALSILLILQSGMALASWQPDGLPVSAVTEPQYDPELIPDGDGGVIIAWTDDRDGNSNIYAQRVSAAGDTLWARDGVPVCTDASDQRGPALAPTAGGGALITWVDERNGGNNDDIYIQSISPDGTPNWTPDGLPVTTASFDQNSPTMTSDGEGGAIIAWIDRRTGTGLDIYAQRVDLLGATVWTTNGVPVAVTPETQTDLRSIESGTGHTVLVWRDYRDAAGDGEIYAQRLAPDGSPLWGTNGLEVSQGAKMLGGVSFSVTTDGAHGCIAAWHDQRQPGRAIHAQRVRANGVLAWPDDLPLSPDTFSQSSVPTIVPDGSGGAIAAWSDTRGSDPDIYAQRVDSTGTVLWPAGGMVVADTTGTQAFFASTPAPSGAIIVWRDDRNGNLDLYGQLLDLSGNRQWESQGTPVCTASGVQGNIRLAHGLPGVAIAVWTDQRGSDNDIYADEVGLGVTGIRRGAPGRLPFTLHANTPNPFPSQTALRFSLTQPSAVVIDVFGPDGRRVWSVRRPAMSAGMHSISFSTEQNGRRLPSGVYSYRLRALGRTQTGKMVLVR